MTATQHSAYNQVAATECVQCSSQTPTQRGAHPLPGKQLVLVHRCNQLVEWVGLRAGHDGAPDLLSGGVQGQREADTWEVCWQLQHDSLG